MKNYAKVYSRASVGLDSPQVAIETHISSGLPSFNIVGLAETAVKESKERVRSAIINSQFKFPMGRITISLSPANLPKKGGRYDLPIALSLLLASGQINSTHNLENLEFYGELGLDGALSPIDDLFPAIVLAAENKKQVVLPRGSADNLAIIKGCDLFLASDLLEVCGFLSGNCELDIMQYQEPKPSPALIDLSEVKGQFLGKRALEIAASGGHNLLFSGTPGSGKTMLAERMATIMPPLEFDKKLEVMAIYSVAGKTLDNLENGVVFRAPHHLSSAVSLIGGGADPKPGEISLAHNGVLFLDELPEFSRSVIEVLRQPLESGVVNISRAKNQVQYPANFTLIAAQNPCPCGYFGDKTNRCHCTMEQVNRYQNKVSGPFLDRIDLKVNIVAVANSDILDNSKIGEKSPIVKARVAKTRELQFQRQGCVNSELSGEKLEQIINLTKEQKQLVAKFIDKLQLSTRAYYKSLKVARTIADMEESSEVENKHLIEALSFQDKINTFS